MELLKKILKSLSVGLMAGSIVALFTHYFMPGFFERLENISYYVRYNLEYDLNLKDELDSIQEYSRYGINIIDIDDRSMSKMGLYHNWDRSYHAHMIDSLCKQFPAAIVFDIFFSNPEDSTHQKRTQALLDEFKARYPSAKLSPEIQQSILSTINYDRQFTDAIRRSNKTYLGIYLTDTSTYSPLSRTQLRYRTSLEWHNALKPQSALLLPPEKASGLRSGFNLLDGTFPALAQASKDIGHIMAEPNDDSYIREIPLLLRFRQFDPVYLPISLRSVVTLFGTPNDEIVFEPGRYIDIGKPFKITRNMDSTYSFSYPDITMAMVRIICNNTDTILKYTEKKTLSIAKKVIAIRDESGGLALEMTIPGVLPSEIVNALYNNDFKEMLSMQEKDTFELGPEITLRRDSESEFVINAPFDAQEWYLYDSDILTLSMLTPKDFEFVKPGERRLILHNFGISYFKGHLLSSIPVLRDETLQQLCEFGMRGIESILPGMRQDFGKNVQIPLTPNNDFIITFFGPKKVPFKYFSYYDILNNNVQGDLDGKIFIVGSSASGLFDLKTVPIDKQYPGMEVHASIMNSLLTNTFITRLSDIQNFAILLIVGMIIGFISYMFKPVIGIISSLLSLFIYGLIAFHFFSENKIWIEIARPLLTIIFSFSAVMVFRYITEERNRKFLQNTFKQYLSPELIDIMYKNRKQPALGGDEGVRSAFFTDIQGFSTFSEKLGSPTRLVELLNEYLGEMTDILLKHFGTLDKYEGDAIIACFGAPMQMDDHAYQACMTALDMQNALAKLRKKWISEGDKWPQIVHEMRMRIGINSGIITAGNMGSSIRKNYTIMGDAVNLAARLESAAKQFGVYTMISQATYDLVKDYFIVRQVDKIQVVGKSEPVVVYELISDKSTLTADYGALLALYNDGLSLFYKQQWDAAIDILKKAHDIEPYRTVAPDGMTPSLKIIRYCEYYKDNPPGADWDGVSKLTSK
jgi:class 3 adenylate cyclase/CHASE2 domain-containing sensor protein